MDGQLMRAPEKGRGLYLGGQRVDGRAVVRIHYNGRGLRAKDGGSHGLPNRATVRREARFSVVLEGRYAGR